MLTHIRSRYLANSTLFDLHYSYNFRLRTTLARVTRRNHNVLLCRHRRNHGVNLLGGVHTCTLRSRNCSAMRTGRRLNFTTSRHSFALYTSVFGLLNIGRIHLLAGGPGGIRVLARTKVGVIRHMPLVMNHGPGGRRCLSAGTRGVNRLLGGWPSYVIWLIYLPRTGWPTDGCLLLRRVAGSVVRGTIILMMNRLHHNISAAATKCSLLTAVHTHGHRQGHHAKL